MHALRSHDLRHLLKAVEVLHEDMELATLPARSVAAITRVVPADIVTYNDVDLARRIDRILIAPADARLAGDTPEYAAFIRHIDEHPLIQHNARTADPVPRKISDFLSQRRFRNTTLHSEFFRLFDVNYQMALVIRHAGLRMIGIALNRSVCDFTERERTCLVGLRSHLVQSYRQGLIVERLRGAARSARAERGGSEDLPDSLTRRELEVLRWVSRGKSNEDIGRIIGASSATVKKHLEHIYDKLGLPNRTAAGALYIQSARL